MHPKLIYLFPETDIDGYTSAMMRTFLKLILRKCKKRRKLLKGYTGLER